jgi:hypothetical protein
MPSIEKAQADFLRQNPNLNTFGTGRAAFPPVVLGIVQNILSQYGAEFKLKITEYIRQSKAVSSGNLSDSVTPEVIDRGLEQVLQISLANYYDFVNKGVKGVRSSRNAPNSPYQFRNFGVPDSMRQSLQKYVSSGKAKIGNVRKDKALGIGLESKGVSAIDTKVNTLGYLIKAYGIKPRGFFDKAYKEVFKDLQPTLVEAVSRDIVINLSGIQL